MLCSNWIITSCRNLGLVYPGVQVKLVFFLFCFQLLSLEEKLRPTLLSSLEEHSQMSRLFACRSLSTVLRLIGNRLHCEAFNKIYPGK